MSDPDLRFSRHDADLILRRAAEIEGADDTRRMTTEELRAIAQQAGFGRQAVERAIAEAREATSVDTARPPVQRWGWAVMHVSAFRELPIEIGNDDLMRIVRLFHPYREGAVQVELEEGEITWHDARGLRFSVTSGRGVTGLRVFASKLALRRRRWVRWVRAAADRLEMLAWLVAARGSTPAGGQHLEPRQPLVAGPDSVE
jgi:hypothetical protein